MVSNIYISAFIAVLAQVLPHIGISLPNEELQGFVSTGVTILAALWVMISRFRKGDINAAGIKTE